METKTEFRYFTIAQWQEEGEYLSRRHQEGWKFVKVDLLGRYRFVRCEPEDVVYQLDYNQEGWAHREEYLQMFRDCGWEYLQDYFGYSYFRKPAAEMQGREEIFCDEESRLEMMKRVIAGRMLPLLVVLLGVSVIYLTQFPGPVYPMGQAIQWICLGLFMAYTVMFLWVSGQFLRLWRQQNQ